MDVMKRKQLIRIIEKMERDPVLSEKLGIRNKSILKSANERNEGDIYEAHCY